MSSRHLTQFVLLALVILLPLGCSDSTLPDPNPPVETGATGVVVLPPGMAGSPEDFQVLTVAGVQDVDPNGSFRVPVAGDGPSLVLLVDADDHAVLMGYVDNDPAIDTPGEISAHETATALLYYALRVFTLPGDTQVGVLGLIRDHAATADLATAVASALAADARALTQEGSALVGDITDAVAAITSSPEAGLIASFLPSKVDATEGLSIEPTGLQSGIEVSATADGIGLQVTNHKRRNAWYYVYKVGYEDFDGNEFEVTPPSLIANGFVGSIGRILGGPANLHDWSTGQAGFEPKVSAPIALDVRPAERKAIFEAAVAGGHMRSVGLPTWYDSSDPRHEEWSVRAREMLVLTLVKDLLAPAVFGVGSPLNRLGPGFEPDYLLLSGYGSLLLTQNITADLQFTQGFWAGAVTTILEDLDTNEASRGTVLSIIQQLLASVHLEDRVLQVIADLSVLTAAIEVGLEGIDAGNIIADNTGTQQIDRWDVTASVAVGLTATRTVVNPNNFDSILTAQVEGLGNQEFCYRWTMQGIGELSPFLGGGGATAGGSVVTEDNQIQYLVDPTQIAPGLIATIYCEAFVKTDGVACTDPPAGQSVGQAFLEIQGGACDLTLLSDGNHVSPGVGGSIVTLIASGCESIPDPWCIHWSVIGSGEMAAIDPSGDTDERYGFFSIDNDDIVEGGQSIVRAELYGKACGSYGPEDLLASSEYVLTHDPFDILGSEPCADEFDYEAWSQHANGISVTNSGSIGQLITVNVSLPPLPEFQSTFSVEVAIPQAQGHGGRLVVKGGDAILIGAGNTFGRHSYAEGLPDVAIVGALVRVRVTGSFGVTIATNPYSEPCGGAYPCCPLTRTSPGGDFLAGAYIEVKATAGSYVGKVVRPVDAHTP